MRAVRGPRDRERSRDRGDQVARDHPSMPGRSAARPCTKAAGGRGFERAHPSGQNAPIIPRKHVAGAGRGQPGAAGGVDRDPAVGPGSATTVVGALEQDDRVGRVGERAGRRRSGRFRAARPTRRAYSPSCGREDRRRAEHRVRTRSGERSPRSAFRPSASSTSGTGRVGDELGHRGLGPLVAARARARARPRRSGRRSRSTAPRPRCVERAFGGRGQRDA